jgi:hypothetical protein
MSDRFTALLSELDQAGLEELRRSVAAEVNARRPAAQIADIRVGMSAAEKETVAREIARVLRGEDA